MTFHQPPSRHLIHPQHSYVPDSNESFSLRSASQVDQHSQGRALGGTPPVTLIKIGDAPKRGVSGNYSHPLDGIRVLDLSRILAGPVCGRTLAGESLDYHTMSQGMNK
jgi:hypothetical protein